MKDVTKEAYQDQAMLSNHLIVELRFTLHGYDLLYMVMQVHHNLRNIILCR